MVAGSSLVINLTPDEQRRIEAIAHLQGFESPADFVHALVSDALKPLTATDLLKLPLEKRQAYLKAMAVEAESDYRQDHSLTDFEAFSEDDLYDETP